MKETTKKPIFKRWWFWVIIVVVVVGAIGSQGGKDRDSAGISNPPAVESPVSVPSQEPKAPATSTPELTSEPAPTPEPTPALTLGQKNALAKADDYLSIMAFSYSGLIEQLEFEGFTTEEATYAADNCGADWNEQAAKKAQDYLDTMSFSRDGLIEQLEYEGFTSEQAKYGVTAVGY